MSSVQAEETDYSDADQDFKIQLLGLQNIMELTQEALQYSMVSIGSKKVNFHLLLLQGTGILQLLIN